MSEPPPQSQDSPEAVKAPPQASYADAVEALATELMGATKRGDRDAFDRLTRTVRGRAYRVAASLVGSGEDALDLTQEALLKTYRARDSYRDGEPFLPWFHRILRNTCISFLRRRGRVRERSLTGVRPGSGGEEVEYEIVDEGPGPSHALERSEAAEAFWTAFNRLSARDREILSLRHFDELSYRAIAHALEIPEGTVMSRLFHARRRLREALAPHLDRVSVPRARPNASPQPEATP